MNTITIAEIAQHLAVSADWMLKLKRNYWKEKFPAPLLSKGKKLVFDRNEVMAMLEKYPYVSKADRAKSRRISKDMPFAEFAPKAYVINLDYLNWLSGGVNESIRLAYNDR